MAEDKKNKKNDADEKLLAVSPKAKAIANVFYNSLKASRRGSLEKLWRKNLAPLLRKGLVDKLVPSPKDEMLKDDVLIHFTYIAIDDSDVTPADSYYAMREVAPYALEVASLVKDAAKRNALYRYMAEFYRRIRKKVDSETRSYNTYFETMLAAYAKVQPRNAEEASRLKKITEANVYSYAQHKLDAGNVKQARKFFEMCGAHDLVEVIDKAKNPKKLLKGKYSPGYHGVAGEKDENKPAGIESVLRSD